ncbi:transglutaminase domain-containing protein [Candidatus Woesearchaeota archaeon]|nr:transglutaminase domain-containing protein [Candidatus Woesearchaeota archaeon]
MRGSSILILLIIVGLTQGAPDYTDLQSLVIDVDVQGALRLAPLSDRARILNVTTDLYFHPIDDGGTNVLSLTTTPTALQIDDKIRYIWERPTETRLSYTANARVKTTPTQTRVGTKAPFPIPASSIPIELRPYLSPTTLADYEDPAITNLAWELSAGEDDLYTVVNKLATWVHDNVKYDLSTTTVSASIKASQVLRDRAGVCDELTNLFIALTRAIGIPARFISGLAYTNSDEFLNPWGAHGWAEVYFPGTGWVAFDPTFGQYGWVDASHIKLKESQDASEPSTKVQWTGTDTDLSLEALDLDARVIEIGPRIPASIALSIEPSHERVRIGSHNSILVITENPKTFYQSVAVRIANTQGVDVMGAREQVLSLAPGQSKAVTFIVHVDPDLDPQFQYTFPILVTTERGQNASTVFFADSRSEQRTSASISINATTTHTSSISCAAIPVRIRAPNPVLIECVINTLTGKGELCAGTQCVGVFGTTPQKARLRIKDTDPGEKTISITLKDEEGSRNAIARYIIADVSTLRIEANVTPDVGFDQTATLRILLSQTSVSIPQRIVVSLHSPTVNAEYPIDTFIGSHRLDISIPGKHLAVGENTLRVVAEWQDENGAHHITETHVRTTLASVTLWQSIQIALERLGNWILTWVG